MDLPDRQEADPRALGGLGQTAGDERTAQTRMRDAILAAATDHIYVYDQRGRFLYVGPASAEALGLGSTAMLGKTGRELGFPAALMQVMERQRETVFATGQSIQDETCFTTVSGVRDYEYTLSPIRDEAGEVEAVLCMVRDMTTHKQAETALQAQADQVRLITDAAPLLISYVDSNQRYRFNNKGYADWFGRSPAEINGRHVREVLGEPAYQSIRPHLEAALSGQIVTYETAMPYAQGRARFVHTSLTPDVGADGQIKGCVGVVTDITDQKRSEQALLESESRKSAVLEVALDCIITIDQDAQIVEFNPAAEKTFGYTRDEVYGRPVAEVIIPSALREQHRRGFAHYLATGEGTILGQRIEVIGMRKSGEEFPVEIAIVPMQSEGRTEFTAYLRDISERQQKETERERLLQEIRDAAEQQRLFLRDVLTSVTDGKLRLCHAPSDLPMCLQPEGHWVELSLSAGLFELRHRTQKAAEAHGFAPERWYDLMTAVSEAGMNAVVHAGGGRGQVCGDDSDTIQVWVEDQGHGIDVAHLPRATLEKGYTTAGTLGHGMKMMLQTADRVFLLTGPTGTTVVLEQDRVAFMPAW